MTLAAAERTVRLGTRLVNIQGAAVEFPTIQLRDSAIGVCVGPHLDKSEPFRPPCVAIGYDADAVYTSVRLEHGSNRILGGVETETTHKNIFHNFPLDVLG